MRKSFRQKVHEEVAEIPKAFLFGFDKSQKVAGGMFPREKIFLRSKILFPDSKFSPPGMYLTPLLKITYVARVWKKP